MMEKDIWRVLNDPKEKEAKEPSDEQDDIFASLDEIPEITDEQLPF